MAESIERLLAELEAAASSLRVRGAALLPVDAMLRVEQRAAQVAAGLLQGEPLRDDRTDELLSVEAEVSPAQEEQRPVGQEPDQPVASAPEALGASGSPGTSPVGDAPGSQDEASDEDVFDEATVIEGDDTLPMGLRQQGVAWDEVQTFVSEEDSDVSLEAVLEPSEEELAFVDEAPTPLAAAEEPVYVVEEPTPAEEPVYVVEEPGPAGDLDEDGSDDPSDASLVSFTDDGVDSYITYEEVVSMEEEATVPAAGRPAATEPSYVSFDEVPVGGMSDADLALGEGAGFDEDEEVTLGSVPRPEPPASVGSVSDVGEDALVTIEDGASDAISDLDADDGIETFDLMGDITEEEPILEEEEEVTLTGLEEEEPEELLTDAARGVGAHAQASAPRVAAASPRVTAGLYGNPSVPTIREGNDPVPKAAAVQLNAGGGGGRVLGLEEEEEPIELGSVGDYGEDEDEYDHDGEGLSLAIQEYEEEEEWEEEEIEIAPEPAPPPPPRGPSPEEIQAVFERAQAAANSGALQEAADLYSDVVDADPDHLEAHVGRGRLYLDLGDYSRAMSDFMVAEEIDENSPEPLVAIGDLYFHRKDYRKAIEYFNTALQMAPNHAMAYCRRGISHYYRKHYRDALGDLEKANKLDPDIPNIASFISMAKRKAKSSRR